MKICIQISDVAKMATNDLRTCLPVYQLVQELEPRVLLSLPIEK